MLERVTPLILTFNEAPNIERTLSRLSWAQDIVVVDSGSTDATLEILRRHQRVRVFVRPFTTHAEQWAFGLSESGICTTWVLALDADYVLSEALVRELEQFNPEADVAGYRARFIYCVEGKPLRGGVYPPGVVLYRRLLARYVQDGHTQRVLVKGRIGSLCAPILHDDRKSLSNWLAAQAKYMRLEALKVRNTSLAQLGWNGKVRKLVLVAPLVMLIYCLVVRGGVLDGRAGLFYALQRSVAESILSLYLLQGYIGVRLD